MADLFFITGDTYGIIVCKPFLQTFFQRIRILPVSYTPLDVYKRQVLLWVTSNLFSSPVTGLLERIDKGASSKFIKMCIRDSRLTDRFLTSSDYLSLQNITLGYTLPKSLTRKMQIDGVRVFFVADNVALLTARKGLDPRQGYVAADNVYSPIRTISGGISLNF